MTTASIAAEAPATAARPGLAQAPGWLSSRRFDLVLIVGTAGLAFAAAACMALYHHVAFGILLFADLWLLGYHHVIATFARMGFEADALRRHRALLTWVPLAVLAGVLALAFGVGAWTLPTIYLYWQWWHYTRQSYGVAQLYRMKTGQAELTLNEMKAVIYILPLAGILYRSYQAPEEFLGMELRVILVPLIAVEVVGVVAAGAIGFWAFRLWRSWRRGQLAPAYTLYLLTHLSVFGVGYFAFPSIDHGWLVINMWHNAQYLLIVRLFNTNRFKDKIDPAQRIASTLSLKRNVWLYFGATLGLTAVAYLTLSVTLVLISASALPIALVAYQTINFHHYIVDSVIWKVRKPQVSGNLGIQARPAA